ncbi:uncharacterized protein [Halyomorpha halys]|uniref:uncharacterized protein n=1 Tax=Halyomorpha halys TaxID=286706 RepID=UPI0034D2E7E2
MGNCLAPDISNILNDLDSIIPLFSQDIISIKKYVDDLYLVLNPGRIPEILSAFNSYHLRLRFTVEGEFDYSLPFLDLLIIRNPDGSLSTDWYTKPTYSGRLLNYFSQHPYHQIINVAKNLIHNNFPHKVTNKLLDSYINHITPVPPVLNSFQATPPLFQYRSLPYIPILSGNIQKSLRSTIPTYIGLKYHNKISNLFSKLKDPIPFLHHSYVVYRISCSTLCCNSFYIGETKYQLKNHISQHKTSINSCNPCPSKLSEHTLNLSHAFNFDNTSILATVRNHKKRLIAESIHINLTDNSVYLKVDKDCISLTYRHILNLIKSL